jgi:SAM-dependent methyltransferase
VVVTGACSAGSAEVVWHDLECGAYRADLPLWRELADRHPGPILDVGAGTGRVTLDLLGAGHRLTALDLDADLLAALRERAASAGRDVETVRADARSFELARRDYFALCLVPMQTLQLLGGPAQRVAFLRRARDHLRPGGLIACAIVTALDSFDCAAGDAGPLPETARVDGTIFTSRATRVTVLDHAVAIERERRTIPASEPRDGTRTSAAKLATERNLVELDRLSVSGLGREAIEAGLALPLATRDIPATVDHVGSTVVMFGA